MHLFGGGQYIDTAVNVALENNCDIVIRTSDRFAGSFKTKNQQRVKIFCGNDLLELMDLGGWPGSEDLGLSFSAPWILPREVISSFEHKLFNLHNQLLPLFRGAGGVTWNILEQSKDWGVSIHHLTEEIDAGDIVAQQKICGQILNEPASVISKIIENKGAVLVANWLDDYFKTGEVSVISENNSIDSYYWPRLNTEVHGWIDWSWDLDDIISFCHAFSSPFPGAKTKCGGNTVRIWEAVRENKKETFHPFQVGIIYRIFKDSLFVAHPDGAIRIRNGPLMMGRKN